MALLLFVVWMTVRAAAVVENNDLMSRLGDQL